MKIKQATPEEFSEIIDLFRQYDFALVEKKWFEWKHLENPTGHAKVFKLLDGDRFDGTVAVMPQTFYDGDRKLIAMQAVDGLMGRTLRGKGLFNDVMAFVASLDLQDNETPLFRLGFASLPASMKALENVGWLKLSRFRMYKAILDTRALASLPGSSILSIFLKPLLSIYRAWLCWGREKIEVHLVDRFTEDMNQFQPQDRITGDRSADFLNWRVIDNPRDTLYAFCFYRQGKLVGYAVCKELPNLWEVLEFRTSLPGRLVMASFLKYISTQRLTSAVDFWLMEGFEQFDKLPIGLLSRGVSGAMFVSGHRDIGLSDKSIGWAAGYLDSDW